MALLVWLMPPMAVMAPGSRENVLGYEPQSKRPKPPEHWRCVLAGVMTLGVHAVVGIAYWPVKFIIDHQAAIWLSVATDWLFPILLPLPFAALQLGINQGMSGQELTRLLYRLSLLNSLLYGVIGAFVYRRLGRRR